MLIRYSHTLEGRRRENFNGVNPRYRCIFFSGDFLQVGEQLGRGEQDNVQQLTGKGKRLKLEP